MAYTDEYGVQYSDDKKKLIKFEPVKFEPNLFSDEMTEYSVLEGTEVIGTRAFKGNKTLKVIHLPYSIRLVESEAFSDCKIEEIHFGGSIEQWLQISWKGLISRGYRLYFNDTDLVESIIIPESISVIKESAFYYCTSLKSVIFNKNITLIERDAFNKSGLKGILSIPKSCQTIKQYAFFNCSGITRVKIPEATQSVWYGAFSACYGVQSFVVSSGNEHLYTDGIGLYSYLKESNSNAIDRSKMKLVALASGYKGKYRLHENTVSIVSDACCFASIPGGELEIAHNVEIIDGAFRSCRANIKIKVPITMRKALFQEGISSDRVETIFNYQDALITQKTPEVISHNPFRVLGVYCNASQREIQSNAARIKRFLEIGKQPSFQTDFNEVLPPIERTQEMVDKALSQISQPKEKLAFALLWFSKPRCEQHKNAEALLRNNKADEACELLLHNSGGFITMLGPYLTLSHHRSNCDFSLIDFAHIVHSYYSQKEYTDNNDNLVKLDKSLFEEICGDNFDISEDECQILLFDKLMTFVKPTHLWASANGIHFSKPVIEHLFSMSIGKNIANINSKVAAIKTVDKKDSPRILKAAKELKHKTEQDIAAIDDYLPPSDVRYISVHDALADQILQSAIDSYNHAENTSTVARDVYALMQYAGELAKGDLVKNRCEDNIKVVKKVVDELPPAGLETADKQLFAAVTRARNSSDTIEKAKELLKEAEPHLFKINLAHLTENNKDLAKHILAYFTKVSTVIANVCLNKIIEDVNSSRSNKSQQAWTIIQALNQLPLDPEFRKARYDENVDILIKNMSQGLFGIKHYKDSVSYDLIDLRPESDVWKDCKLKNDYRQYIKRFPKGAHINEAKTLQAEIERRAEEKRKLEAEQRRKREEEQHRKREIEAAEREIRRKEEQKREREEKLLNWAIGILIVFIVFEVVYLIWGWDGVTNTLIAIGVLAAWIGLSLLRG